jgi:YceI-like protein
MTSLTAVYLGLWLPRVSLRAQRALRLSSACAGLSPAKRGTSLVRTSAVSILLVAILLWGLAFATRGQEADRPLDASRSTITVHVFKEGLFRAFADDHVIQAPLMDGSLDEAKPHMQIVIDASRLRVLDPGLSEKDRQDVQARMLGADVLDVERFRWISFHSISMERRDAGGWLIHGELELHGNIRPLDVNVRHESGRYKGSVVVKQSDFGIVPIRIMGGTVKVKDEVRIDFDVVPS